MSANDVLDVLNISRDQQQQQPAKKKQKLEAPPPSKQMTGMARELYSLLGPNTPPVALSGSMYSNKMKDKINSKLSPWTRMPFRPLGKNVTFYHWVRGSKELLEQDDKPYAFDKFNTSLSLPELMAEEEYVKLIPEFVANEIEEKKKVLAEKRKLKQRELEKQREKEEKRRKDQEKKEQKLGNATNSNNSDANTNNPSSNTIASTQDSAKHTSSDSSNQVASSNPNTTSNVELSKSEKSEKIETEDEEIEEPLEWSYEETKHLFDLCKAFELKWNVILDRFRYYGRTQEDLKEHFYRVCVKILEKDPNANPNLIDSLKSFSKTKEIERKQYLENLLKRTPAEIAEEESLVIEARRFELAAKKMLAERSYLLNLLDSPQSSQSVQQYQSSQGLANLYNNLMILDKHQKKRQQSQLSRTSVDPVPPPIPMAASSSVRKERNFQTHLQQYLAGLVKQNQANGNREPSPIQQLLAKRLTTKEEEAYGLHYHANEKINPGVTLRSQQRLPGLQQRQSVLKSVNNLLQEMDIPTAGGTNWKPVMPTRKSMAKYDQLLRSVVALLEVKKGKDKLESEIKLIKEQRDIQ